MTRSTPGRRRRDRKRSVRHRRPKPVPPAAPASGCVPLAPAGRTLEAVGPGGQPLVELDDLLAGWRPSAARRSPPRPSGRGAGSSRRRRSRGPPPRAAVEAGQVDLRRRRRARRAPPGCPRPPSVVALPPIPRMIRRMPPAIAFSIRRPVPRVDAPSGSWAPGATRDRPDASASSMKARCPSSERSQPALTSRSERARRRSPGSIPSRPANAMAWIEPSPPSPSGACSTTIGPAVARDQPAASARADLDGGQRALERVGREQHRERPSTSPGGP